MDGFELTDDGRNSLGGSILLLNVSVDEDGNLLGELVDLVLLLGDGQLSQKLIEHLDALLVLRHVDEWQQMSEDWESVERGAKYKVERGRQEKILASIVGLR